MYCTQIYLCITHEEDRKVEMLCIIININISSGLLRVTIIVKLLTYVASLDQQAVVVTHTYTTQDENQYHVFLLNCYFRNARKLICEVSGVIQMSTLHNHGVTLPFTSCVHVAAITKVYSCLPVRLLSIQM